MKLPRECVIAGVHYLSTKTYLHVQHSFSIFLKSRCTQMTRNMSRWHRPGMWARDEVKGPVAKLRSLPWICVWTPQRRSGVPAGLPHRRAVARVSSLWVGKGDASLPLLVFSQCDPPTRRGRRTLQDRTLPTHAQVFLNYSNVALELRIMPFRFMFY